MFFKARSIFALTALAATLGGVSHTAEAQAKPAGFTLGYTDIGPAIGVGGLNGASATFGGRFEKAIKPLPDFGNGLLGIQASFDYYSWSSSFVGYSWSYRYIPIGVTANYHFKVQETKIDPFIGLGLGYNLVSCNYDGPGASSVGCGYSSGLYFIGRAGARYFFNPRMAAYGDVGTGAATLNLGVMFKLQ